MITGVFVSFINLFVFFFNIVLLARVVWSWFDPVPSGGIGRILIDLTEPVLQPIRRLLPPTQMLDFAPLLAFIMLQLLAMLVNANFPQ